MNVMGVNIQHRLHWQRLWKKIKGMENYGRKSKVLLLSRSRSNNSENYCEKYKKIRFNSDDDLPLKRTL